MIRNVLLLMACWACFATNVLADSGKALKILLHDNTSLICAFSKKPVMTFADGTIQLSCTEGDVASWEFSDVASWSFIDDETASIHALTINAQTGDDMVRVYDVSGKLIIAQRLKNSAQIDLSTLKPGVYILKTKQQVAKFTIQ